MTKYVIFVLVCFFSLLGLSEKALSASPAPFGRLEKLDAFPEIENYVQAVGHRLAKVSDYPNLPYHFIIINESIPNAYSFPNGNIVITRGFLLKIQNEAELASVLAHEIGHQTSFERERIRNSHPHAFQTTVAESDLIMTTEKLSDVLHRIAMRADEYEADKYGILYLAKAGYDVQAAIELQRHFLLHENKSNKSFFEHLFDTHPYPQSRIDANIQTALEIAEKGSFLGINEFKKMIEPLKKTEMAYKHYDEGQNAYNNGDLPSAYTYTSQAIQEFDKEPLFYGLLQQIKNKMNR